LKELPHGPEQSKWDEDLVNSLAFIKKNRRYPFSKMTLMPLISSILLLASLIWLTWEFLHGGKSADSRFPFLIVFLMAVPILAAIGRYFNLIRFRAIHTPLFLSDNMNTIQQFLEEQKLVTFRHAKLPEVFQILSRNISAIGEDREILIFIADDKRILINSHYTSSRKWFRFLSPPTHEREMIKLFMEWLARRAGNGSANIVQRGFS
jgi:hypothetical protein